MLLFFFWLHVLVLLVEVPDVVKAHLVVVRIHVLRRVHLLLPLLLA